MYLIMTFSDGLPQLYYKIVLFANRRLMQHHFVAIRSKRLNSRQF